MPILNGVCNGIQTKVAHFEGEEVFFREPYGYWVTKKGGMIVNAGRINGRVPNPSSVQITEILISKGIFPWSMETPLVEEQRACTLHGVDIVYAQGQEVRDIPYEGGYWYIVDLATNRVVDIGGYSPTQKFNGDFFPTTSRRILAAKGLLSFGQENVPPPPPNVSSFIIGGIDSSQVFTTLSHSPGVVVKRKSPVKRKPKSLSSTMKDFYFYKTLSNYVGLEGTLPVRAGTTFVGVEVELEKITSIPWLPSTWSSVEDGSLKDNGKEFIIIPIRFKFLEMELQRLFKGLPSYGFSSRCSIHVHMNARDFSLLELKSFILLYVIFERLLFRFSGNRWNNNFCVPLYFFPQFVKEWISFLESETRVHEDWFKYFGLNISPLFGGESQRLGTIEFRHMEGTDKVDWIINWINLIVSLKISAKKMKWEELVDHLKTMNTTSGYYWLTKEVFREFGKTLLEYPTFKEDIEAGITQAKKIFLHPEPINEAIPLK